MQIQDAKNVHMVGIKGVGMTALALILHQMGKKVQGSDVADIYKTDSVLKNNKINILQGFSKENINDDIDLVITTAAHGGLANIEVETAKERSIHVLTHAQALGQTMKLFKIKISVCGSHGKTTVSAMAAYVFHELGVKFGYHVGTASFSGLESGGFTGFDYFVTEADEYMASPGIDDTPRFMYQDPDIIIATNIDYDHPDVYRNLDHVKDAFKDFIEKLTHNNGTLIYYKNDVLLKEIVQNLTLQMNSAYDLQSVNDLILNIPGKHNLLNAASVMQLFQTLGFDRNKVHNLLTTFSGSSRRSEKIYESFGLILYDDYAHHPLEIAVTIDAFRRQYPTRRLIVIFQPHTYSRTNTFKAGFIQALAKADLALVTEIFSSKRENAADFTIDSQSLVAEARVKGYNNIFYCPINELKDKLTTLIKSGDVIITMGAGSIYQAHSDIIEVIKLKS
ncbi:hypothetical protein A3J15_03360 [Candidatus Roizmanbacteria bacterium RIFCSPLOWO2_02_FULL_38_10]|uniref:UDP-N-acetylmuramate--L-alanine ligase n=1 Tax=Candidatus Roizmanbacteria bacterium RIFCSPLOWO2_02_FULL_38_10 TaxID=1802074 RepID=A0A1F7JMY3_9BACT|nr:MAG: hypothetical protein A3J15_03360 [Candidatus Roizmanbacteria bacterium RIFCSPLOWO2_02_FULL_38_10]